MNYNITDEELHKICTDRVTISCRSTDRGVVLLLRAVVPGTTINERLAINVTVDPIEPSAALLIRLRTALRAMAVSLKNLGTVESKVGYEDQQ